MAWVLRVLHLLCVSSCRQWARVPAAAIPKHNAAHWRRQLHDIPAPGQASLLSTSNPDGACYKS